MNGIISRFSAILIFAGIAASSVCAAEENHGIALFRAIPYEGRTEDALAAAAARVTIPMASFKIISSKDGNTYDTTIVGASPTASPQGTTTIDVLIVPVIVQIGTTTFDPTAPDSCILPEISPLAALLGSPLLKKVVFDGGTITGHAATVNGTNIGRSTYVDGFRRAEFWSVIKKRLYHTVFKTSVAVPYTINAVTVASIGGGNVLTTGCASLGVLSSVGFENYVANVMLPTVAGSTKFVLFVLKDVVSTFSSAGLNCRSGCTIGYHTATGSPVQTYGVTSYDTTKNFWNAPGITDISIATHEIAEWLNDPLANNPTPAWGNIGQVGECQGNWEVGDPLTGTNFPSVTMANGVTYHPQEVAFESWYYNARTALSLGAGGKFSMNGTFGGPSKPCPPGGTY